MRLIFASSSASAAGAGAEDAPLRRDDLDEEALLALVGAEHRPPRPDRPWTLANMVVSLDGATRRNGVSAGLSGPGDRLLFHVLRSVPDAIVVGSGTVRAERYGPVNLTAAARAWRRDRGRGQPPRLVVVSGSLDLGADLPLLDGPPPLVVTSEAAIAGHPDRFEALSGRAEVVAMGTETVNLAVMLAALRSQGVEVALFEGGPNLNAQLVTDGLLDELAVTISPVLAGPVGDGVVGGAVPTDPALELVRVLEDEGMLLCRYLLAPGRR